MEFHKPKVGETYLLSHVVGPSQNGMRLDAFLKETYRRRSRAKLKQVIDEGRIQLKRPDESPFVVGRVKPSLHVLSGDQILIMAERKPEPAVCFDYQVLFEDDVLFVIEKPANLPVHPAGGYYFNTLLIHLKTEGHRTPLRADQDYYLPHRIDKETSGILVIAKDQDTCNRITTQFADRKTQKYYLAIVHGQTPDEFEVDWSIRKALKSRIGLKMEAIIPGKPKNPELDWLKTPVLERPVQGWEEELTQDGVYSALTRFKRLETIQRADGKVFSVVACYPKTGRQHQIRVHLAAYGFPIVGDKLYSITDSQAVQIFDYHRITPETEAQLMLGRHALHAAGLEFTHPVSGQKMNFESPLPTELREFLSKR